MIVNLPDSTTGVIASRLVSLRADTGAMALSRVLTLVVVTDEETAEQAISSANDASRQHPCRVLVTMPANRRGAARIDAQIRVGGDAGASEIVVLQLHGPLAAHGRNVITPLLLADSPLVTWWPRNAPKNPSMDPIGAIAQRRVTDSAKAPGTPRRVLKALAAAYEDGDTDLAWTRITRWRALLAAALDQAPYQPVLSAIVTGAPDSPSADLLAGWLAHSLKCRVRLARSPHRTGVISVRLARESGNIDLVRPKDGNVATLSMPGRPERTIALAHRSDAECLADELHRLDADEVYADALKGLGRISTRTLTEAQAVESGVAPDPSQAEKAARRLKREARASEKAASMVDESGEPQGASDKAAVHEAARRKLSTMQRERESS